MRQQVMKENGQLSDAMDCGFYVHGPRFLWPVSNPGFYNMAYAGSGKFRHNTDWQGEYGSMENA